MRYIVLILVVGSMIGCTRYVLQESQYGIKSTVVIDKKYIVSIDTICSDSLPYSLGKGGCVKNVRYRERSR